MAGPTLWNFKMIPCFKCGPVGHETKCPCVWKFEFWLFGMWNIAKSLLLDLVLSLVNFSFRDKEYGKGQRIGWLPFSRCPIYPSVLHTWPCSPHSQGQVICISKFCLWWFMPAMGAGTWSVNLLNGWPENPCSVLLKMKMLWNYAVLCANINYYSCMPDSNRVPFGF